MTYAKVDERVVLKVLPKLITTDESLRQWKPEDRGCYFDNERALLFFRLYTSRNCVTECQANITLAKCKCSLLGQPRE